MSRPGATVSSPASAKSTSATNGTGWISDQFNVIARKNAIKLDTLLQAKAKDPLEHEPFQHLVVRGVLWTAGREMK